MSNLRRLTTAIAGSARVAEILVTQARQVAGVAVTTGQKVGDTLVDAATSTAPALAAAAQQLGATAANLMRSRAGQRVAGVLLQLAVAQAARVVVRTAFGPIAGNLAAGVVGIAAGLREIQPRPDCAPTETV
jgi:hypothetical protein